MHAKCALAGRAGGKGVILVEWELGLMWSHWDQQETQLYSKQNYSVRD